jgi:hypothetical protein
MSVIQQDAPGLRIDPYVAPVHDSNVLRNRRRLSYNAAELSLWWPASDVPAPLIEAVQQVIAQLDLASLEGVCNVLLGRPLGSSGESHSEYLSHICTAITHASEYMQRCIFDQALYECLKAVSLDFKQRKSTTYILL